ncbi:MAG: hypothetical protein IAE82_00255, partial [Opitutaceae bacterium]|nr:hypothetical protein [Opitutaceae bacterium]
MKLGFRSLSRPRRVALIVVAAGVVGACATVTPALTSKDWQTRAIPESQGVVKEVDGKRIQQRYPFGGFGTVNFETWPTYATGSPENSDWCGGWAAWCYVDDFYA